ncbi:hypothetical protein M569_14819, partial [Genlisea aurea]
MAHLNYYQDGGDEGSQHCQSCEILPFKTSAASLGSFLLHGNLDIWVKEAKHLPNMDLLNKSLGVGRLSGKKVETSDPYVTIVVAGAVIARTFVIRDDENPVWEQHFYVPVAHYGTELQFVVKDSDILGSEIMGAVGIPVEQIILGLPIDGTYPILGANGKQINSKATLSISIHYIPIDKLTIYDGGVGSSPSSEGVPGTYFPLRRGGNVTLYQDAHVNEGSLPNVWLDNGMLYQRGCCWRDIYDAILRARRLIYIAGWSVNHLVRLVRDDHDVVNSNLGELLRAKSQEGVRVLLLVWDDPTSTTIFGYKTEGVMNTGDDDTRRYFKRSSVRVLLCPRNARKGTWAKKQ